MKKTIVLFALVVVLFGSCTLPGTGTLHIRNMMDSRRDVTALSITEQGTSNTKPISLSSPLKYSELRVVLGVDPGSYVVEALVDGGPQKATFNVGVQEEVVHVLWVTDGIVR